jgi:Holliday junction resolvase RusA-like endonuclease
VSETLFVPPLLLEVVAYGHPRPQGSKRAFVNKRTGRPVLVEQSEHLKPWREAIVQAAVDPSRQPLPGPLRVSMVFTMPKPLSAPKTRVTHPMTQPDLSKLCRAAEDALTDAGVWVDDAQVVEYIRLAKVYPREDQDALHVPGIRVRVWAME